MGQAVARNSVVERKWVKDSLLIHIARGRADGGGTPRKT